MRLFGNGRVQSPDRLAHRYLLLGESFCPKVGVTHIPEPLERGVFDDGFVEVHLIR